MTQQSTPVSSSASSAAHSQFTPNTVAMTQANPSSMSPIQLMALFQDSGPQRGQGEQNQTGRQQPDMLLGFPMHTPSTATQFAPTYPTGGLWRGMQPMHNWSSPITMGPRGPHAGGGGNFSSPWPFPNCGVPGHSYKMCTALTGLPLHSEKIAAHIANMEQRDQIKDMQTAQVNQALLARGLGHLQQPLPSELKRMRNNPYGTYGRGTAPNVGWQGHQYPQQPHGPNVQRMHMLQQQSLGPGYASGEVNMCPSSMMPHGQQPVMFAYPPSHPLPPLPVSLPAMAASETEWVVVWGPFKGAIPNAHAETTARLQPLRGYKSSSASDPWNESILVIFDSKENADNAAVVLGAITMTTADGTTLKLETKTPVLKTEHPQFRPPATPADLPKQDSKTMKEGGPDHTGDLTMAQTEESKASKVTPEAKRYKKPASDKDKGGANDAAGVSSSAGGNPICKPVADTSDDPGILPVAAVLRLEKIERAQQLQGEAIEAQGKQLVSLENKVNDTSTQVGLVGSNVQEMLRDQQEQAIKNSREWHNVGEIDAVGRRCLRGSVKKPKTGTAYYIIAPDTCSSRYTAHQALVQDTDAPCVFWRPMADGVEGFSADSDDNESTPDWVFEKVEVATDITGKLNRHLHEQHERLKHTLGTADAVVVE